jgi:bifunctional DNA-binding transcriptional regulator/antitoxin component of YhaV-PrlF toxin-antitoxin module
MELREKLGLTAGTVVQFELRDGAVLLRKGSSKDHPVDRVFGRLSLSKPVDELIDQMRGPRPSRRRKKVSARR